MTLPPDLQALAESVLTAKQLEVFKLRLRDDMSYRDIGIALNIHEATVRGHYQAALRRLEPHLKEAA